MLRNFRSGRWLMASAFIVASCSQGDTPRLTSPTVPTAGAANGGGIVGSLATGDVKVGAGAVEIDAAQLDRQTPAGVSILRQYALPGVEYRMEVGETIQIWVEYDRGDGDVPSGVSGNPKLLVDWGEGEIDRFDFSPCGACKLKHTYPRAGRYTVKVTLDNRAGTTVTRTFFLNSVDVASCVAPSSVPIPNFDVCSSTHNLAPYFSGSGLTYTVQTGVCAVGQEVSASFACSLYFADPTIGVLTATCANTCVQVTATNACGSTFQRFKTFSC